MIMMALDPAIDNALINKLLNYHFTDALHQLTPGHPPEVHELVHALARLVGSPGWFDGDLATVINAALAPLLPEDMR